MKRCLSLLLTLCLLAGLTTTASAAGSTTASAAGSTTASGDKTISIGIYGTYHEVSIPSPAPGSLILDDEGDADTTLPDGTHLTLDGDKEDAGLRVVVIAVTATAERDAYTWVAGEVSTIDTAPLVWYVMFYRGDTAVTPTKPVKITVTAPADTGKTALYYMSGDGKSSLQQDTTASLSGKSAVFSASKAGYYLLLTPASKDTEPGTTPSTPPGGSTKPNKPTRLPGAGNANSPKTLDPGMTAYVAMALTSYTATALLLRGRKRK